MSNTIIKVSSLGKKYSISHEVQVGRYTSLRDTLSNGVKNIFNKNRKKTFEDYWALNDINFEINQGDAVGIIGHNGAGKSTLLKILSRIIEPSTGRVEINGRIASLLEVGTGFHPELTGKENIFLNGAILGMSRSEIKSKFDEIVDFSGVEKFLDTPVKRYSSGMYVRLAFAVAAHLEPEILIVDEVLAVGDAEFQKKCLGKMNEVSQTSGKTVLLVSHNMNAIKQLSNKALLLNNGRLEMAGATKEVLEKYQLKETGENHERVIAKNLPAAITGWYLDNAENKTYSAYTRETFTLNIPVTCTKHTSRLEVGIIIRDLQGENIFGFNTRDFGGNYFDLGIGEYLFQFKLRLPIKEGAYFWDIALVSDGSVVDQWFPSKELAILDKYESVLDEKWRGILQENFDYSFIKTN